MNGRYLLDTNIIIALFAKDPVTHERIAGATEVFVPCIAIGEIYFGARKSSKIEENLTRIDELPPRILCFHAIQRSQKDMVI